LTTKVHYFYIYSRCVYLFFTVFLLYEILKEQRFKDQCYLVPEN